MPTTITATGPTGTILREDSPAMVLGYRTQRQGGAITHDILGGGVDATVRTGGLRAGTLELLYVTEAAASASENMHRTATRLDLTSTELTTINMRYVVTGALERELEDQTRSLWVVRVGFQEVT